MNAADFYYLKIGCNLVSFLLYNFLRGTPPVKEKIMTEHEILSCLQSIIMQASRLYQEIAHAPALTFADQNAPAPAYAKSELKKISRPFRTA